ncbi:hypothetical protein GKQ38_01350 [Candidatus Nanohaloarchaea archaeon]|nr:hypothetical protein GKQ38_01350 [Candidatus Nanohaloarchaea archaeon]
MFTTADLTERQEKLNKTFLFMIKLLAAGGIFHLILYIYPNTYSLQVGLAQQVNYITGLIGMNLHQQGIYLISDSARYYITQDCLGWKSMAMFTGLVFAGSTKFRNHLKYVISGVGLIYLANLIRVVSTLYLAEKGIISFGVIHGVMWKWGLTALVLVMWVAWFNFAEIEEEAHVLERELRKATSNLSENRGEK